MNLVSISENKEIEKRLAITPEIAKKYINLGLKLSLPENYGLHLGFSDEDYKNLGVDFLENEKDIINRADIIVQLGLLDEERQSFLKENQILIGSLNAISNEQKLKNYCRGMSRRFRTYRRRNKISPGVGGEEGGRIPVLSPKVA